MKTKQQTESATPAKDAPQPETDFEATHRDKFDGLGGEYTVRDGKRVLLHRTRVTPAKQGGRRAGDPPAV